jgi:hypothetical protein
MVFIFFIFYIQQNIFIINIDNEPRTESMHQRPPV